MLIFAFDLVAISAGLFSLWIIISRHRSHIQFFFMIWGWVFMSFAYLALRLNDAELITFVVSLIAGLMFALTTTLTRYAFGRHRW